MYCVCSNDSVWIKIKRLARTSGKVTLYLPTAYALLNDEDSNNPKKHGLLKSLIQLFSLNKRRDEKNE